MVFVALVALLTAATSQQAIVRSGALELEVPEVAGATRDPTCADTPKIAEVGYCAWIRRDQVSSVLERYDEVFEARGLVSRSRRSGFVFFRPGMADCGGVSLTVAVPSRPGAERAGDVMVLLQPVQVCEGASEPGRIGFPKIDGVVHDKDCVGAGARPEPEPPAYCWTVPRDRIEAVFSAYAHELRRQGLMSRWQGKVMIFSRLQAGRECDVMRLYRAPEAAGAPGSTGTLVSHGLLGCGASSRHE